MVTAAIGFLLLLLGTGLVFIARSHPERAASLETAGGSLVILGLAAIGAGLALQAEAPVSEAQEPAAVERSR